MQLLTFVRCSKLRDLADDFLSMNTDEYCFDSRKDPPPCETVEVISNLRGIHLRPC